MYLLARRWFPKTRRSRTASNFTPPESRELRRGRSTLHSGRGEGHPAQSARDSSLQEEGGDADFTGCDRDAMEAREAFWSVTEECIHRHHVMPRGQLYLPKESSLRIPSKYIDVVRQTKTTLDRLEEGRIDESWNFDEHVILPENGADPRDSAS